MGAKRPYSWKSLIVLWIVMGAGVLLYDVEGYQKWGFGIVVAGLLFFFAYHFYWVWKTPRG